MTAAPVGVSAVASCSQEKSNGLTKVGPSVSVEDNVVGE